MDSEERFFAFLEAVIKAQKEGQDEFCCPVCGGTVAIKKSGTNGHISANCNGCVFRMIE